MSEHPLDRELRMLIDLTHQRLTALVDIANVLSDTRRMEDDLDFDARVISSVTRTQGGPLNGQAPSVTGNGAYANAVGVVGYRPQTNTGAPSPISGSSYSLQDALRKAAVETSPYPEETTYNSGVPEQYRKTYGY